MSSPSTRRRPQPRRRDGYCPVGPVGRLSSITRSWGRPLCVLSSALSNRPPPRLQDIDGLSRECCPEALVRDLQPGCASQQPHLARNVQGNLTRAPPFHSVLRVLRLDAGPRQPLQAQPIGKGKPSPSAGNDDPLDRPFPPMPVPFHAKCRCRPRRCRCGRVGGPSRDVRVASRPSGGGYARSLGTWRPVTWASATGHPRATGTPGSGFCSAQTLVGLPCRSEHDGCTADLKPAGDYATGWSPCSRRRPEGPEATRRELKCVAPTLTEPGAGRAGR